MRDASVEVATALTETAASLLAPHDPSRGGSTGASLVTARETLRWEELHRTRAWLRVSIGIAAIQLPILFVMGGDPTAKAIFLTSVVAAIVICGGSLYWFRRDEAYSERRFLLALTTAVVTVSCSVYFYGLFGPGAIVAALGINFFCAHQNPVATTFLYVMSTLAYALLAVLMLGLVPDPGFVQAGGASLTERIVLVLMVEGAFFAVFLLARNARATALAAIERHDEVVRSLAQRDALLQEARHDLVEAMRAGGIGRYSGQIVGSFRLGSLIGRGGMGEVYEALQLDTNVLAAVKVIPPELLADREVAERFFREASITSSLSSVHVVRVIETSPVDAPIPYLAMERLRGGDLSEWLRDDAPIAPPRLVAMLEQVAVGLDAAHVAGVIHRDLKPRNLFCSKSRRGEEVWKILDFGVSKLVTSDATLTGGQLVGTPAYMAPEQACGQEIGPRADIFALGVIAYRSLTGSPPFSGENSVETLFRVCYAMPPRPSALADLRPEIDLVLAIALAKDPKSRFATAAELARAFADATRGTIDPRLADRARSLLVDLPWGASSMASLDAIAS